MDASKEEKQQYLVAQIIDRGYDPEEFQEYLIEKNGSMIDLDSWSLTEIKEVVSKFQVSKEKEAEMNESG